MGHRNEGDSYLCHYGVSPPQTMVRLIQDRGLLMAGPSGLSSVARILFDLADQGQPVPHEVSATQEIPR